MPLSSDSCCCSRPARPVVVGAGEAEQLRGEELARVLAGGLLDELEARDVHLLDALAVLHRELARQVDEARVLLGEVREDGGGVAAQDRRDALGDRERVLDQVRRGGDAHRRQGDRQLLARAVGDRAAAGGDDDLRLLLGRGGAAQGVGLDDAEPHGPGGRERQPDEEEGEDESDAALDQAHQGVAETPPPVAVVGAVVAAGAAVTTGAAAVGDGRGDGGGGRRGGDGSGGGRRCGGRRRGARPSSCAAGWPPVASACRASSEGGRIAPAARRASPRRARRKETSVALGETRPSCLGVVLHPAAVGELGDRLLQLRVLVLELRRLRRRPGRCPRSSPAARPA